MSKINKQKLLIATRNKGKVQELSSFLSDLPVILVYLSDLGIKEDIVENGKTYQENSQKKAIFYAQKSKLPTIADDGGIEIDALNGKPGILSRRYFGKNGKDATDEEIITAMKKLIKKFPQKKLSAKFKTVVSFALPSGKVFSQTGIAHGILKKPLIKLMQGYPYRSFFYLPKIKKYYHESELTRGEERLYNHRYKALEKLKPVISHFLVSS